MAGANYHRVKNDQHDVSRMTALQLRVSVRQ